MRRVSERWWMVGVVILLAVAGATILLAHGDRARQLQRRQTTEREALTTLHSSVDDVLARETAVAGIIGVQPGPIGPRWPALSRLVMDQPLAATAGFFVLVPHRERAAFERRTGLKLTQFAKPGKFVPAPPRKNYIVATHVAQRGGPPPVLGVDLGASPVRRAMLERAARTGEQVASPPIALLSPAGARGVVVYAPVRTASGRFKGWVAASYSSVRLAAMVARLTPGVRLTVRDGASTLIGSARHPSGMMGIFDVGGRRWQVWTSVAAEGVDGAPWLVLGFGLLLTIAVMLILRSAVVRERYASAEVAKHIASERARQREVLEERRALTEAQTIAKIGSWSIDPGAGVSEWSAEMYRIFDRDPADGPLIGEAFLAALHPDDRGAIARRFNHAMREREPFDLHGRLLHDDGTVIHLHAIGRPETDGRYTGTIQDTTQAAELRDKLAMASARLQAVLDNSPMGVYMRDLDGRFVIANEQLAAIRGTSAAQLIGASLEQALEPEAAAEVRASDESVLAEDRVVRYEEMVPLAAGEDRSRTYLWQKFPVRDAAGRSLGVGGIALDMTDRVEIERALRETEERFRGAFDEAPIGMTILALDGCLMQVNDALCALLGYSRKELVGRTGRSLTHPDDLVRTLLPMAEMRAGTRKSYASEVRYLTSAGHPVSCALQATVLSDSDGAPRAILSQIQDITDRKRHEEQLEYFADHDALTGLLNRRAFARELASHADRGVRYGAAGTVLMIDIDNFKYVNDTLGHHAGDELITRVAHLLDERMRSSDVLGRLGGDEFAVLLPRAGMAQAEEVAQSVIDTLRGAGIQIADTERRITASIGVASFEDDPGLSAEDVLINADLAMYDAKEDGRDRYATFKTDQYGQPRMKARVSWAQRINDALENDGFTLLAQPIADLRTGTTTQYELLLRMSDGHGDLIPPATFLYIAERLNLMPQIDGWVTTRAIQMLSEQPGVTLEVNLSARSLGDPALLALIEQRLRATGVAPERLVFEVTETAALSSVTKARAFGEQLSALGCRFALDDFGAGFGSFYYLKHLVFDYLKIDGEFIRECCSNPTDRLVIQALVDIARGMHKQTIAEFVGDDETIDLLRHLGVDYGQGYHLGRPAPLEEHLGKLTV